MRRGLGKWREGIGLEFPSERGGMVMNPGFVGFTAAVCTISWIILNRYDLIAKMIFPKVTVSIQLWSVEPVFLPQCFRLSHILKDVPRLHHKGSPVEDTATCISTHGKELV